MTKRICKIEDCDKPIKCRQLCNSHYKRFIRHGCATVYVRQPSSGMCAVNNCNQKHKAKGFCATHYYRVQTSGDPMRTNKTKHGKLLSFLDGIKKTKSNQCIEWPFGKDWNGYGAIRHPISRGAHAVSLFLATGNKPDGAHCLHDPIKCNNPSCVNPNHLRWGTHVENMADKKIRAKCAPTLA